VSERVALRHVYRFIFFALSASLLSAEKKNPNRQNHRDLQWTAFQNSKKMPIVFVTPQGLVDQKTGQVDALQRSTLWQGETKITADHMVYAPKTNTVTAKGRVEIQHANGSIVQCSCIVIHWNAQSGTMSGVRAFSPLRERFTAKQVQHTEHKTALHMASYTPCDLCQDRLNPLWSIHAREMVVDQEKKRTEYTDAHFSVLGTPVFYVPYFYVPTKRASGIVSPNIGMNAQLGGYVGIPYFSAIGQEHDVTVTPYVMTRSGVMLATQYRGHTQRHKTMVQGAINPSWTAYSDERFEHVWAKRFQTGGEMQANHGGELSAGERPWKTEDFGQKKDSDQVRLSGFIHGKTEYYINDYWRFTGEQWWVSNKTFLETRTFFGNSQATFLPSHATFERFDNRHYWNIRSLNYQGLQPQDRQRNIPYVLPELNYAYTSPVIWKNSTLSLHGNALSLYRNQGNTVQRFHMDGQWDWPNTTPWGQKIDIFIQTSGTVYASTYQDWNRPTQNKGTGYMFPQAGVTSRWPFLVQGLGRISPIVQFLVAPKQKIAPKNPNEDSQSLIFDESNFLNTSRFSGYDRLDQTSRMNYGIDWSKDASMGMFHVFLGQSYAFTPPNPLLGVVGIRMGQSDYVGQVDVQSDYGDWIYRFRLDAVNGSAKFQEIGWQTGPSWALISGSYAFGRGENGKDPYAVLSDPNFSKVDYNQLVLKVVSKIGNRWTVKGFSTHDFYTPEESAKLMDVGCGIGYQNECFSAEISVQKSFYTMQDIQPGWTIGFYIRLNGVGELMPSEPRFDHGLTGDWSGERAGERAGDL